MNIVFIEDGHHYYDEDNPSKKCISVTTFIGEFVPKFQKRFWSIYTAIRLKAEMEKPDFSKWMTDNGYKFYTFDLDNEEKNIKKLKEFIEGKVINNKRIVWDNIIKNIDNIQEEWKVNAEKRGNLGTRFHELKEKQSHIDKIGEINSIERPLADNAIYSTKEIKRSVNLKDLEDGFHTEVLLYTHLFNINDIKYHILITGQIDKLYIETINGIRYVDIDDYKTNKKKNIQSKENANRLLSPLGHLSNSNYSKYTLQLGLYGRILEEHGFVVRNLYFTHHDIDELETIDGIDFNKINEETKTVMNLKYLKEDIEMMIKVYCKRNHYKIEDNISLNIIDLL